MIDAFWYNTAVTPTAAQPVSAVPSRTLKYSPKRSEIAEIFLIRSFI